MTHRLLRSLYRGADFRGSFIRSLRRWRLLFRKPWIPIGSKVEHSSPTSLRRWRVLNGRWSVQMGWGVRACGLVWNYPCRTCWKNTRIVWLLFSVGFGNGCFPCAGCAVPIWFYPWTPKNNMIRNTVSFEIGADCGRSDMACFFTDMQVSSPTALEMSVKKLGFLHRLSNVTEGS